MKFDLRMGVLRLVDETLAYYSKKKKTNKENLA
jgi:hypothetical protein